MKNNKIIKRFLNNFVSKSTIGSYKAHLKAFFNFLDVNPDDYIKDVRRMDYNGRLDFLDKYESDVTAFWQYLNKEGKTPKTISDAVSVVRVFLKENRINLDDKVWDNIRRRGKGREPITEDKAPTNRQLKSILIHGDAKSKALFLILSSSGMRITEALSLIPSDIDFNSNPTKINIRAITTKTKSKRVVYISNEARDSLMEWLKIKDDYIQTAIKRTNLPNIKKLADDDRIFPFQPSNARNVWNGLIKKTGLTEKDKTTDRYIYHIHTLRKFFRTQFSKQDRDICEILLGHQGYLNRAYLRITDKQIKEAYLKGVKHLLVFETPIDENRIKELEQKLSKERMARKKMEEEFQDTNESLDFVLKKLERLERDKEK